MLEQRSLVNVWEEVCANVTRPPMAAAIAEKNFEPLLDAAPLDVAAPAREVFLSLSVPELFAHDAGKKFWKRVKKLMYGCGIGDAVYGGGSSDAATETTERAQGQVNNPNDHSGGKRTERFNKSYREFLHNVVTSLDLATEAETVAASKLDEMKSGVGGNDAVREVFKKHVLPTLPKIAEVIQHDKSAAGVSKALDEYFTLSWFVQLPCVEYLDVTSARWSQYLAPGKPVRDQLLKEIGQLILCMSGIDALLNSPIVRALRDKTVAIMRRERLGGANFDPSSPDFQQTRIMGLIGELMQELPAATGGKVSATDVQTLITNVAMGKDDVPAGFHDLIDIEDFDLDCLDAVMELPGIGDVLSPLMAGMEGNLRGGTGAPAFGAVEKPAWLKE